MYSLDDLREAAADPHLALREVNRLFHRRGRKYNTAGVDVFSADWDNLVVLDACRYDAFASQSELPGRLERRRSRGAATPEFVRANFGGRTLHDTVYVTKNTWYLKLRSKIDAELHSVSLVTDDGPAPVTEEALRFAADFPNKRLVVHYLPPHHPFVGPTADEHFPGFEAQSSDLFEQIRRDEVSVSDEVLQRAYHENLDRVLPEVWRLLEELDGRTVVTADHGEILGERCRPVPVREYGHHVGLYVDELVEVPWLVSEGETRRRITAEDPTARETGLAAEEIDQRLRDLGYKI